MKFTIICYLDSIMIILKNFKKGNRDKKMVPKCYLKAFAIPTLTAITSAKYSHSQNRDSKSFRIYFHFLVTLGHHFFDP